MYAAVGCWVLTFCVNSNFWYILKRSWVLRMNISGLFNISSRLHENSVSRVNGLAGKVWNTLLVYAYTDIILHWIAQYYSGTTLPRHNTAYFTAVYYTMPRLHCTTLHDVARHCPHWHCTTLCCTKQLHYSRTKWKNHMKHENEKCCIFSTFSGQPSSSFLK